MHQLPQWINWKLIPNPDKPKPDKVPFANGEKIDPHNPAHWMTYDQARAVDPEHIGFVLTPNDPYFCIDLDHCRDIGTGALNELATATVAMFPGVYSEVSYSGDGIHVFGQGVPPEQYSTRGPGVEIYKDNRFIAITGAGATGAVDMDCTGRLAAFCALRVRKRTVSGPNAPGYTTGPVAEHTRIPDDLELILKAMNTKPSAAVAFAGKPSFKQLFEGDPEVIADGASEADAAMAAYLAFWTGKDGKRIERIMRMSKLVRPKWDRRGDNYLHRTIIGACAVVSKVYTGGKTATVAATPGAYEFMDIAAMQTHFAGCTRIIKGRRVLTPHGILTSEEFNDTYSNSIFQLNPDGSKVTKFAFEAFARSRCMTSPVAMTTCFRPELAPNEIINENGVALVNTYSPAPVVLGTGDVSRFLDLLARILPVESDRNILIAYMAAVRQYPGVKFQWTVLIQGVEGNGKSAILKVMEYCVGYKYTHRANAKELGDSGAKFTGWLDGKLLIVVEEIHTSGRRDFADALKPLITEGRIEIQAKGRDQVTTDNRANFAMATNHKDAIRKTMNDRRYCMLFCAQQSFEDLERDGMTGRYFTDFYNWLIRGPGFADVAGWLDRYEIPDELNPATDCQRAPITSTTVDAIQESLGPIEYKINEAIDEERQGFKGGWVSSVAIGRLLLENKLTFSPRNYGRMMRNIEFVPHPALHKGMASRQIFQEDNKRPTLYVKSGTIPFHNLSNANDATANYINAQGYSVHGGAAA